MLRSQSKLCYIGFSQGTAQAFAAFSTNPDLLEKVNLFVALSPAVRANHLSKSLLLSLVQANLRYADGAVRGVVFFVCFSSLWHLSAQENSRRRF